MICLNLRHLMFQMQFAFDGILSRVNLVLIWMLLIFKLSPQGHANQQGGWSFLLEPSDEDNVFERTTKLEGRACVVLLSTTVEAMMMMLGSNRSSCSMFSNAASTIAGMSMVAVTGGVKSELMK